MNHSNKTLYEKYSDTIDHELKKRAISWTLTAVPSMSWNDCEQIIRFHLFKKIHLYNSSKSSFNIWCSIVIMNQLKNILRNNFNNFVRPCSKCNASFEECGCDIYNIQNVNCPLYEKWIKSKQGAYFTKLPLPLPNHEQEVKNLPNESFNLEKTAKNLHARMKEILKPNEWKIYSLLYIEHKNESFVAKIMGFKTNEVGMKAGYGRLHQIKKSLIEKAKKLIYSDQVDFMN